MYVPSRTLFKGRRVPPMSDYRQMITTTRPTEDRVDTINRADLGPRIRAACAYSSLDHDGLASRLGLEQATLRQIETGRATLTDDDLWVVVNSIASVCGVSIGFFSVDFQQLPVPEHPQARRFEERLGAVERELAELRAEGDV